ncbi:hypothetical protein NPIL_306681 [Nephila pilipes]|uniref:Uncharacterized protein n=1 Tax=Nephila pilipes TaxID=299642 RepID=A0A8X6UAV1_NEPPI|nr:hypothetical protein NPIL_306681 [Nephila pilipes]
MTTILTGRSTRMFKYPTAAASLDFRSTAQHRRVPCARDCSYACLSLSIPSKSAVKKQKGKNIGRFCLSHSLHDMLQNTIDCAYYHQRMLLLLFSCSPNQQ